jgi:hypothetical protein
MQTRNFRTSGSRLYLPVNSTQADFSTATPVLDNNARTDISVEAGELYINYTVTPNWKVQQTGLYRGMRVVFFGAGADNSTFNYRVWAVFPRTASTAPLNTFTQSNITSVATVCFGTGTGTLSTLVGEGDLVPTDERYADELTFVVTDGTTTPTGIGDVFSSAYNLGTPAAYNPANNSPAMLIIPDISNAYGLVFEFDVTGATSVNALIELTV